LQASWAMVGKRIACLTLSLSCAVFSTGLTQEQQRGKRIFLEGSVVLGGEITAVLDGKGAAVPASIVPCAGCHGSDGRGRPEGGIIPPDITWETLTKPYGVSRAQGPKRPPYTERLLKRAILDGIDSSGVSLATIMPRYHMSSLDLTDLIAYLRVLGTDSDPGITSSELRVGVVLPAGPHFLGTRDAVSAVLDAYARKINQDGGIFGRKLTIRFFEQPDDPRRRAAETVAFLERENVFVLMASALAGAEEEMASMLAERKIPVIGAFALYPQVASPSDRYIFYLLAGITDQAFALADFAQQRNNNKSLRALIIHGEDSLSTAAAARLDAYCKRRAWMSSETIEASPSSLSVTLREKNVDAVFILAPSLARAALRQDASMLRKALYLIPSSLVDFEIDSLPVDLGDRIFLSVPTLPSDTTASGLAFYQSLFRDTLPPQGSLAAQWSALSSAELLVEALRRAGRDVSREQIVDLVESFQDVSTGLSPKLTFGPNHRIGSPGAHIFSANNPSEHHWFGPN
jgi:ABC-type branched-subunit amino acid transport system substrate-binding protein